MKDIIKGKVYDTEKANLVYTGRSKSPWFQDNEVASLWRTLNGRYFITGLTFLGKVAPLQDEVAAMQWLNGWAGADTAREHFPHLIEEA